MSSLQSISSVFRRLINNAQSGKNARGGRSHNIHCISREGERKKKKAASTLYIDENK